MNLTTLEEAAADLAITVDSLLNAVFETIAPPAKVFGWTANEYARVRDAYAASTENEVLASSQHNTITQSKMEEPNE